MILNADGNSVIIYYASFKEQLPGKMWDTYLQLLPKVLQEKNNKFRRWQDRHANLYGKLLLMKGMMDNFETYDLSEISYNDFGRPSLSENFDFNISHAGHYVVCAMAKGIRLGVDIEEVLDTDFEDYKRVMTQQQWHEIKSADDPTNEFFRYWTIKESVIKADSRGMTIPLLDIHIFNGIVSYDGQSWYLSEFFLDENYRSCLATNDASVSITFVKVDFSKDVSFVAENRNEKD